MCCAGGFTQAAKTGPGRLGVTVTWRVETCNGLTLAEGPVLLPPSGLAPGAALEFRTAALPGFPTGEDILADLPAGGEAWVCVTAKLEVGEVWASAGHEIAREQLPLASSLPGDSGAAAALAAALALEAAAGDGVTLSETAQARH